MHEKFIQLLNATLYRHIRKASSKEADIKVTYFFVSRPCQLIVYLPEARLEFRNGRCIATEAKGNLRSETCR